MIPAVTKPALPPQPNNTTMAFPPPIDLMKKIVEKWCQELQNIRTPREMRKVVSQLRSPQNAIEQLKEWNAVELAQEINTNTLNFDWSLTFLQAAGDLKNQIQVAKCKKNEKKLAGEKVEVLGCMLDFLRKWIECEIVLDQPVEEKNCNSLPEPTAQSIFTESLALLQQAAPHPAKYGFNLQLLKILFLQYPELVEKTWKKQIMPIIQTLQKTAKNTRDANKLLFIIPVKHQVSKDLFPLIHVSKDLQKMKQLLQMYLDETKNGCHQEEIELLREALYQHGNEETFYFLTVTAAESLQKKCDQGSWKVMVQEGIAKFWPFSDPSKTTKFFETYKAQMDLTTFSPSQIERLNGNALRAFIDSLEKEANVIPKVLNICYAQLESAPAALLKWTKVASKLVQYLLKNSQDASIDKAKLVEEFVQRLRSEQFVSGAITRLSKVDKVIQQAEKLHIQTPSFILTEAEIVLLCKEIQSLNLEKIEEGTDFWQFYKSLVLLNTIPEDAYTQITLEAIFSTLLTKFALGTESEKQTLLKLFYQILTKRPDLIGVILNYCQRQIQNKTPHSNHILEFTNRLFLYVLRLPNGYTYALAPDITYSLIERLYMAQSIALKSNQTIELNSQQTIQLCASIEKALLKEAKDPVLHLKLTKLIPLLAARARQHCQSIPEQEAIISLLCKLLTIEGIHEKVLDEVKKYLQIKVAYSARELIKSSEACGNTWFDTLSKLIPGIEKCRQPETALYLLVDLLYLCTFRSPKNLECENEQEGQFFASLFCQKIIVELFESWNRTPSSVSWDVLQRFSHYVDAIGKIEPPIPPYSFILQGTQFQRSQLIQEKIKCLHQLKVSSSPDFIHHFKQLLAEAGEHAEMLFLHFMFSPTDKVLFEELLHFALEMPRAEPKIVVEFLEKFLLFAEMCSEKRSDHAAQVYQLAFRCVEILVSSIDHCTIEWEKEELYQKILPLIDRLVCGKQFVSSSQVGRLFLEYLARLAFREPIIQECRAKAMLFAQKRTNFFMQDPKTLLALCLFAQLDTEKLIKAFPVPFSEAFQVIIETCEKSNQLSSSLRAVSILETNQAWIPAEQKKICLLSTLVLCKKFLTGQLGNYPFFDKLLHLMAQEELTLEYLTHLLDLLMQKQGEEKDKAFFQFWNLFGHPQLKMEVCQKLLEKLMSSVENGQTREILTDVISAIQYHLLKRREERQKKGD